MDVQSARSSPKIILSWYFMRIAFRTDASLQIGTGHVMRCLTLADALHKHGVECLFICRPHRGNLLDLITLRGHRAIALPVLVADDSISPYTDTELAHARWLGTDWGTDATDTYQALGDKIVDWFVVDHYALDGKWERVLRPACQRLMVIDDLADREHDCDLLLDQNLGRAISDYSGLISASATLLIGPQYALLRPEFALLRAESLARRSNPRFRHLLIAMGGVDKDNVTGQVLHALNACGAILPDDLHITVVMGLHAPWLQEVQAQVAQLPHTVKVLVGVDNMAQLMVNSDLAIGAAGSTSWERCCLGLPSLIVVLAENQQKIAQALGRSGAVISLGTPFSNAFPVELQRAVIEIGSGNDRLGRLSVCAADITDGQGVMNVIQNLEFLVEK